MSNYQKISDNIQLVVIDNPKTPDERLEWINITNAGKSEIEYLRKHYDFDLSYLRASSAKALAQRPIVKYENDYIFLILHFPFFTQGNILAGEIDFFIGPGYLVTIHNDNIRPLNSFFNHCKKDNHDLLSYRFESSAILLYELLNKLMLYCFTILDQNSVAIDRLEDVIFAQKQKKAVTEILELRRNIVNFRKIMQNHKNVLKQLLDIETGLGREHGIKSYFNRLIEYSKTIWGILDTQKEMIEVLNTTNESFLNYRISDIMKTLTIFSVIVFPLTLLAAIFGMNTTNGMPFLNSPNGFWQIIVIMLAGCAGMLLFFEKKHWL